MLEGFMYEVFGEMPAQRLQKCRTIYHLAKSSRVKGSMVDLGTWHGYSTIAMTKGALENTDPRIVYTVDDFAERHGWIGEPYGEEDMRVFHDNLHKANVASRGKPFVVTHLRTDVLELGQTWPDIPIALLHWDTGCDNRLEDDLRAWLPHLTEGAALLVHDTMDNRFGANVLLQQLAIEGWLYDYRALSAGLQMAIKRSPHG